MSQNRAAVQYEWGRYSLTTAVVLLNSECLSAEGLRKLAFIGRPKIAEPFSSGRLQLAASFVSSNSRCDVGCWPFATCGP
jgi:hypothetical protein